MRRRNGVLGAEIAIDAKVAASSIKPLQATRGHARAHLRCTLWGGQRARRAAARMPLSPRRSSRGASAQHHVSVPGREDPAGRESCTRCSINKHRKSRGLCRECSERQSRTSRFQCELARSLRKTSRRLDYGASLCKVAHYALDVALFHGDGSKWRRTHQTRRGTLELE